jgi:hypothetical protein
MMITRGVLDEPIVMVASFPDSKRAEEARGAIQDILDRARVEVDSLFERQGGVADISDVKAIYARFGFRNDVGWAQEQPVIADGNEMIWEVPAGMVLEEAQLLLLALGAQDMTIQPNDEDESWLQSFHPLARLFWDDEPDVADVEKELVRPILVEKKILH